MQQKLVVILTLLLSGRAMTLLFIHRAGGLMPGDPPIAWLMPLIGDAVIGVFILKKTGLWVWTTIITWNALAIWDALSAFIIHLTNPWPEFFMIQLLGPSMFFAASFMHLVIIILVCQPDERNRLLD